MKTILKKLILDHYQKQFAGKKFNPGKTHIPASGKSFDWREMVAMTEAALDGWWTEGRFASKFEEKFAAFVGTKHCIVTNSGSSANLLAIAALTSFNLGKRRLKPGDEVITIAAAFPTTVNPLILYRLIPVFVDVELEGANIDVKQLKKLISPKTKAIFLHHQLGNPFNLRVVKEICRRYNLWLVEDCCDALGSKYGKKQVGSFGDLATFSFYAAHHITTGEGGAVVTSDQRLASIVRSFRDWGRKYWYKTGEDIKQDKGLGAASRGKMPADYEPKFIISEIGYNLKFTDSQAALGLVQLGKIKEFAKRRDENFRYLYTQLSPFEKFFILPRAEKSSIPSWFGFLLTLKPDCPFRRKELIDHLHHYNIGTRMLFTGNIIKQPYFITHKVKFRKGDLSNTDYTLANSLWLGIHQGIDKERRSYMVKILKKFLTRYA